MPKSQRATCIFLCWYVKFLCDLHILLLIVVFETMQTFLVSKLWVMELNFISSSFCWANCFLLSPFSLQTLYISSFVEWHVCFCFFQLSSKSDNRLFRVHFDTTGTQKYPFLEAYSRPIRCISRNRTLRPSVIGRRPFSAPPLLNEIHPPGGSDRPHVSHDADGGGPFRVSTRRELKCSPLLKRFKVDHDKSPTVLDTNGVPKQVYDRWNCQMFPPRGS